MAPLPEKWVAVGWKSVWPEQEGSVPVEWLLPILLQVS